MRHNIEFMWAWFDALRRRDTETMAAALAPDVVWQGVREGLICNGPAEVVETYVSGYDASQEIDSLELLGGERHIVLGVRAADLGEVGGVEIGSELYNVFTIEDDRITRIEDYLRRDEALAAAGLR
jgi:ketosteroid isomerase-like protein